MQDPFPISYPAVMFKAVGQQTRFSRTGQSVVFCAPYAGQRDLSGDPAVALAQLKEAGLDPSSATSEDIEAYRAWHAKMHQARKIGQARFLVTRAFKCVKSRELVPTNRVALIDGWGNVIEAAGVPQVEHYEATTYNHLGHLGAYVRRIDYESVTRLITAMRKRHAEFAAAPTVDNNLKDARHAQH